jgi:hypothetical protein
MSRGLASAANDEDFLREREDRKDHTGRPESAQVLLFLPPGVDRKGGYISDMPVSLLG